MGSVNVFGSKILNELGKYLISHFILKAQVLDIIGMAESRKSCQWVDSSKCINDAENLPILNKVETFIK